VVAVSETPEQRDRRYATYAMGLTVTAVAVIAGTAVVLRDLRRRRRGNLQG
jgi:hypothetical protein